MPTSLTLPVVVTWQLLRRFWPQLLATVALGIIAVNLLLLGAARIALVDPMAGLMVLTLVVLAQLVTTVALFQILRPALPAVAAAQTRAASEAASGGPEGSHPASLIGVALLPFFLYYAAWGFLGDTVRQYSRLALEMAPLGQSGNVLHVLDSRWLIVSVAIAWLLRTIAKRRQKVQKSTFWEIVVVVCETSWIFIGLYVVSRWKDQLFTWLGSGGLWRAIDAAAAGLVPAAHAAGMMPVEHAPPALPDALLSLFWYMLLPVVWLVLAAIVYGYDIRDTKPFAQGRAGGWLKRYQALPAFLRDFADRFVSGYRSRYLPVANGVRLAFGSGVMLLAVLIVGYRLIDWGAAWLWLGAVRLIGQQPAYLWDILPDAISLVLGSQFQDSSLGLLVEPLRICFLAAILETAFRLGDGARAPERPAAQPAG
ncbi:hypothetical protein [Chelatococcus reniformis]|uniref:Uncharacterized protein n=1 Tax=Chelatococcus reniformis TaxID=1494448 RepID=A0A916UKM2_9HYPH|nr:hypothetical protein [Chelatococcus reniformis]GGC75768.1 hypothetical protein GCM10010994_37740 [Chelatococcus reniformis]